MSSYRVPFCANFLGVSFKVTVEKVLELGVFLVKTPVLPKYERGGNELWWEACS